MEPPLLARVTFVTIFEKTFMVELEKPALITLSAAILILYPSSPCCLQTCNTNQIPTNFRSAPNPEGKVDVPRELQVCINLYHIFSGVYAGIESNDINNFGGEVIYGAGIFI